MFTNVNGFLRCAFVVLLLLARPCAANDVEDRKVHRLALVIGNSTYPTPEDPWSILKSPKKDAEDVGKLLKDNGFAVQVLTNEKYSKMYGATLRFLARIDDLKADIVLRGAESKESIAVILFFSGHGYSQDGQLYLTAIDSTGKYIDDLVPKSLLLSEITNRLFSDFGQVELLSFVFLDACRTPANLPARATGRSKGASFVGKFFGSTLGSGGVILFSSADGKPSIDGRNQDENSIFTQAFLQVARTADPSLGIYGFMNEVGRETKNLSLAQGFRPPQLTEVRGTPLTDIRFKGASPGASTSFAPGSTVTPTLEPAGTTVAIVPSPGPNAVPSSALKGGWVWLGDFSGPSSTQGAWRVAKFKPLTETGEPTAPGSIAPGTSLQATTGLYMREEFPDLARCNGKIPTSGNYAECVKVVGLVPYGSSYETAGVPRPVKSPSGRTQYWVQIKPRI